MIELMLTSCREGIYVPDSGPGPTDVILGDLDYGYFSKPFGHQHDLVAHA